MIQQLRIDVRTGAPRALVLVAVAVLLLPTTGRAAGVKLVAAGEQFACAVTTTGAVRCWGSNTWGQLGDGSTTPHSAPADVTGLASGVASVAAGNNHACALTTGGAVKCWGYNNWGQLGDGTKVSRSTPVDVAGLTGGALAISAGYQHTCAVTAVGAVVCWGGNATGQLGNGTATDSLTAVGVIGATSGATALAAGSGHTCALLAGGEMRCWGSGSSGQLGNGTTANSTSAIVVIGSGAVSLAAGHGHTCAVITSGRAGCWGGNWYGQLGDGTTGNRLTPTEVSGLTSAALSITAGRDHTCVITTDLGVKCWGSNPDGRLGDGTTTQRSTPVVALEFANVTALDAGYEQTCAVTSGGGLKCVGNNSAGQLGDGTTSNRPTPTSVSGLSSGVAAIATGGGHTCARTTAGGLKCWGRNEYGELGDGTTADRLTAADVPSLTSGVASVSAGRSYSCAVTTGGAVKCWGEGTGGQLGDGATTNRATPVQVSGLAAGIASVAVGVLHSCAVTSGHALKCWGYNSSGQLGDGTTTYRPTPVDVTGLTSGVAAVSVGYRHSCAVTTGGALKCWGSNMDGQLGDGSDTDHVTPGDVSGLTTGVVAVAAGEFHTCALTSTGGVKCWGDGYDGQLGDGISAGRTTPVNVSGLVSGVVAIAVGAAHACALTSSGGAKCWGRNKNGQLGDGSTINRATPVSAVGLTSGAASVAAGEDHSCAATASGAAKCWGGDGFGQVGDITNRLPFSPVRALGFGRPDFDADDKVDAAVYRPSTGTWFSLDSSAANATFRYRGWGAQAQNDTPAVGDFDGDGVLDPTVFRPSTGSWFILESHTDFTTWSWFGWGEATDTLVPGDYDADGRTDAAVFRSSTGTWYVRPSNGAATWFVVFGQSGDQPVAGDFDGDGKRDPAVYRPSTGTWFWLKSSTSYASYGYKGWGVTAQGDTPAPGDYDGDGKTDLCVFRPGAGTWYILQSSTGYATWNYFGWGTTGDQPVPGDYDGDGRTDGAVYRPTTGTWYVKPSSGAAPWNVVFGNATDTPLVTIR